MAANKWELTLTPDAFIPDATAHPSFGVFQNRLALVFDGSTPETCYSKAWRVPSALSTGDITVEICYQAATETSVKFDWEVTVEAITPNSDTTDVEDASDFSATVGSVSHTCSSTADALNLATITLDSAALKDSMAVGDYVRIKLSRDADDATNDTSTGDVHVFWVAIYEA